MDFVHEIFQRQLYNFYPFSRSTTFQPTEYNVAGSSLQHCRQFIATLQAVHCNVVFSWLQRCTQFVAMLHFSGLRHEKSGQNRLVRAAFAQPFIFSPSCPRASVFIFPKFQLYNFDPVFSLQLLVFSKLLLLQLYNLVLTPQLLPTALSRVAG